MLDRVFPAKTRPLHADDHRLAVHRLHALLEMRHGGSGKSE